MTTTAPPVDLVRQVRAVVEEWHPRAHPLTVRVRLEGTGPALASCEVWTGVGEAPWDHRADLPAGVGATMLDLERAVVAAGYAYDLTPAARPAWRFDANGGGVYSLNIGRPW
ncbi:hypothetical protein GCM10027059_14150 [Myceligenerans halotolerans]